MDCFSNFYQMQKTVRIITVANCHSIAKTLLYHFSVSSVAVKRGCTLSLYSNGNLVDMIMEIQVISFKYSDNLITRLVP